MKKITVAITTFVLLITMALPAQATLVTDTPLVRISNEGWDYSWWPDGSLRGYGTMMEVTKKRRVALRIKCTVTATVNTNDEWDGTFLSSAVERWRLRKMSPIRTAHPMIIGFNMSDPQVYEWVWNGEVTLEQGCIAKRPR